MSRRLIVAPALAAALAAPMVGAQEPTFHGGTHTVSVYATVVDRAGRLVPNLTRDDFEVYDNGKRQDLAIFRNDVQPITIVIMLDRSGSMAGNFEIERDAAEHFVADLLPADKARLGSFSNHVQIDPEDFTSDRQQLIRILHDNLQDAGPTPLWNGTFAAMNALEHQDGRRVVLVFTDGFDNPGRPGVNVSLNEVIDRSQAQEVMVYAIGLADPCGESAPAQQPQRRPLFQRGRTPRGPGGRFPGGGGRPPIIIPGRPPIGWPGPDVPIGRPATPTRPVNSNSGDCATHPDSGLKALAEEGGGGYFELRTTDDLASTFSRVADELHHQYLLAFTATSLDGTAHRLDVRLRDTSLTPRARKSYMALPE
jgi:VWFA-related protein